MQNCIGWKFVTFCDRKKSYGFRNMFFFPSKYTCRHLHVNVIHIWWNKNFQYKFFLFYPKQSKFFFWGGVNRNYLVHLSVAPSVSEILPVQIFLMERNLKFRNSYFTQKIAYDVVVSHDFYLRSFGKFKVTGRKRT